MHATLNYIMLRHSPQTFQAFWDGKIKAQTNISLPFPPSAQLELHLIWNTEQNMLFHCKKIQIQMDSTLFHARSVPLHYLCLVQTRLALIVHLGKINICKHAALPEILKRFRNQSWCQQKQSVTEQSMQEPKFISLSVVRVRTALFLSVT